MMDVGTLVGGILIGYLGDFIKKRSLFLAPFILFSCIMMLIAFFFLDSDPLPYFFVIFLMGVGLGGPYNIVGTIMC
jgi:sugar phosphate permease